MPTSEARIQANRQNSLKSCGPKTIEGKEQSRRNGLKHGLTGAGIVLSEEDADEVELRSAELQAELDPRSSLGKIMVRQMATLSVRMERSARQETAALSTRVRHAAEDFDRARLDEVERLFDLLGEEPRINLRKLRGTPEGADRLILAWQELRDDLTADPRPIWSAWHLDRAVNLTGLRIEAARGSGFAALSKAAWGDFVPFEDPEDSENDVEDDTRKARARRQLVERIDAELAGLVAHRQTLDLETVEIDRREAPDRALFDPSREASLARRYESESTRGFFKALKELRQAEAEAEARPGPSETPEPDQGYVPLASSWRGPSPAHREPRPAPRPASRMAFEALDEPAEHLETPDPSPSGRA